MPTHLVAFLVTAWLLAMLPGAGQALVLRQTVTLGVGAAWTSIAGTATGVMVWSTAAAAGLSAVLLANPTAYTLIRIAGGLVLGYLGVGSLRAARRLARARRIGAPASPGSDAGGRQDGEPSTRRGAFVAGLATNLGNPKAGVFAVSLIPQFIAPGPHVFASGMLLGAAWALTTGCWYVVFVAIVDRGRSLVTRPSVTTWLHGITGTVLIALGVAVVAGV